MAKRYPVGLVGEQYYQAAIRRCRAGEHVLVCREIGNPHDPKALCVKTDTGETIGHIARDNWVQDLIHEEERPVDATILEIRDGARGFREVVLNAQPSDDPSDSVAAVSYRPPSSRGALGAFIRGIFGG